MRAYVERLKILADINDPMVKRRFEDGQGVSLIICAFRPQVADLH
jgi:hypothetical protein